MTTLDFLRDIKIHQSKKGYRFSVDALLLASFAEKRAVNKIADLGAGSGIIGLLMARKYPQARVVMIELQESLAELAERNIELNGLEGRVEAIRMDIKALLPGNGFRSTRLDPLSFDLVVSNPPYRKIKTGQINPRDEKAIARHEISLSLKDLAKAGAALLKHHGRLCIIHLPERLAEITGVMRDNGLEVKRLRCVHSKVSAEASMLLIEAIKGGRTGMKVERPLFIYNEDGSYTDEMLEYYGHDN
ncbi:MAG: tRNA1(Val) (adenine(37)-N6)-methyltransferase [Nitrospirae bacterium]|nr:tRNA1(Val) (adenine(37)-N6)-methyltransferase [Nitrospirota bacterium]